MLKAKLGEQLETWVPRILPFVFSRRLSPAALTITGTLICLTSAAAFALGEFRWGVGLLLAGGAFDILDGRVARR